MSDWFGDDGFDLFGGGGGDTPIQDPFQFEPGYAPPSFQVPPGFGEGGHGGADAFGVGQGDNTNAGNFNDPSTWAGNAGGTGVGSALASFAKMFGMTNKDGSLNLSSLLPLLGSGIGGLLSYNATKKAGDQVQAGIDKSNKLITDTLSPISGMYQPYADLGKTAAARYASMQPSNIASQFGPLAGNFKSLGSGRGINLAQMSKLGGK